MQSGNGYLKIFLQSCKINKDFFTKFHEEHSIAAFWLHTKLQKTVSHFLMGSLSTIVGGLWSASKPIEKKNGQGHWVIDSLSDFEARETEHGDIGFHTAVRWLSLRKVLKRVWEQKLKHFVRRKAIVFQMSHMTNYWCALINELNSKLQDQNLICELHTLWWRLWECCNLFQTSWRAAFVLTCQQWKKSHHPLIASGGTHPCLETCMLTF